MSVKLSDLIAELSETVRNSTTGALDNTKRTRAINRVLQDLQDFADWKFTRRSKEFDFIDNISEYSLLNFVGASMQDNDGSTSIPDFKNPFDLRLVDLAHAPFEFRDVKDVRYHVRQGRRINEYGIDGDVIVINYARQVSAQMHNCDSLTANGTVSASGDATNLTIDTVILKEGAGALNFDVSSGTSMVITFADFAFKDLTTFKNKSHWTFDVYLPTLTNFESIKLEWSDDSTFTSNFSKTETARADKQDLEIGFNKFAFSWEDATETGTPDESDIKQARITITYSSAITDTDFRIDDLRVGERIKMDLEYFSLAMVKDAAGDFQLEFNAGDVTQTDELLGTESRRTVEQGSEYQLFKIVGGKSERDRTDSFNEYEKKRIDLLKRSGFRIRRPARVLGFPGRRARFDRDRTSNF